MRGNETEVAKRQLLAGLDRLKEITEEIFSFEHSPHLDGNDSDMMLEAHKIVLSLIGPFSIPMLMWAPTDIREDIEEELILGIREILKDGIRAWENEQYREGMDITH